MATGHAQYTHDTLLELKDAGLVAASAAAQVGGSNKILDLGGAAEFFGEALIDVTAIETDSSNEVFTILIQGSNSSSFASGVETLAATRVGHATGLAAGETTSTTGRIRLPVRNERNGTVYRYIRAYTIVAGTVATGVNYTCRLCKAG